MQEISTLLPVDGKLVVSLKPFLLPDQVHFGLSGLAREEEGRSRVYRTQTKPVDPTLHN